MARKAAVKEEPVVEEGEDNSAEYEEFKAQVVALKDDEELTWAAIAEQLECGQGKAILAYMRATVQPGERVKWSSEADLATKVVSMRDEDSLSWGVIGVRLGVSESRVRKIYSDTTGINSVGTSIGKGGRHPGGGSAADTNGNGSAATSKTPRGSAKAKAAAGEEASDEALPNVKQTPFSQWTLAQLKRRFNGKSVSYANSTGKIEKLVVKNVRSIKDGEMSFTDVDGAAHTIVTTSIKSVGL